MSCFPQCPQCLAEYENPADRRFHAEPNACPFAARRWTLLDANGTIIKTDDPVKTAIDLLKSCKILAIKGLGGFHLSVDARSDEAVKILRSRKYREEKPLAIMVRDIDQTRRIAECNEEERHCLPLPSGLLFC